MKTQRESKIPLPDMTIPNEVLRALMLEVLKRGENFRFHALGWSMSPFIKEGDILIVEPMSGRVPKVGQVVAFVQPDSNLLLVHRVIQRAGSLFIIQGDNMPGKSDGKIPLENIFGKVNQVIRNNNSVWFGSGISGRGIAFLSRFGMLSPIVSFLYIFVRIWHKMKLRS